MREENTRNKKFLNPDEYHAGTCACSVTLEDSFSTPGTVAHQSSLSRGSS